ncbi:MAG: PAS domain S-box protein, partial [Haloferacaceae archaeon]
MDPRGPDGGGSIRTLVVGDAEGAARTAARLERADDRLDPVTAAGAAAALDALSADVECVVSAHDLPDSDGVALLEAVRESHPDLPFVLRVREDDRAVARAAAAGGVTEYIPRDDGDDGCALLADRIVAAVRRRRAGRSASVRRRARAVDAAPVGVLITDFGREDNPIVYANDRFEEMTGYAVAEARGRNCRFLQGEGTDPDAVAELRAAIEAREPATVELRNYRADGSEFWNRVSIAPLRDDDGTVTHWVGFQQDVTAARERERELRTQRAFLDQCLDAIEDVFYVFDTDRRIVQWNDRLGEVTGYSDGEIAEMGPADFFPEDHAGRVADAVREVFETGSATVRADYLTADGERIPYEFTGTRLTGPDGEVLGFAGTGRDLTERIEYERRLERQNERLEEFASVVSHDLRNPLNVAQGRLELARAERDSDHLRAVADAHERMEQLVGELLTLAREGDVVTDLRAVSLADAAADGWRTVETGGSTLSTGTDAVVRADESRLRQLFENLFRNSV